MNEGSVKFNDNYVKKQELQYYKLINWIHTCERHHDYE